MSDKIFQIRSFLNYWLDAVDEHSLHSPFLFDFYTGIVRATNGHFPTIEELRNKLLSDHRIIHVRDLGSGASISDTRKISDIAKNSLSQARFSSLYNRIIHKYDHKTILELGSSLGINALYLAAKRNATVTTIEGAPEVAEIAALTFEFASAKNIHIIEGDIDATLPGFLQKHRKVDFVFMDANHRYEPTIKYFRSILPKTHAKTVVVIDDIHSSAEMEKAWNEIRSGELVYTSADLYRCGILFFDPSLNKQHVILQF